MLFRKALRTDLSQLVELLANDPLGKLREDFRDPLPTVYEDAFQRIDSDPNQQLIVVEQEGGKIIGMMQLTFIPYLTYQGGIRAQVEGVRVHNDIRGQGMGEKMLVYAIEVAQKEGAHLIQLTTDKQRPDAIRFYEKLGFKASHEGMKLHFDLT